MGIVYEKSQKKWKQWGIWKNLKAQEKIKPRIERSGSSGIKKQKTKQNLNAQLAIQKRLL